MAHKRARERKWNEVAQDVGEQLNPEPQARFFERAGPGQRLTNVIGPWVGSGLPERSSARAWQRGVIKTDTALVSEILTAGALFSEGFS